MQVFTTFSPDQAERSGAATWYRFPQLVTSAKSASCWIPGQNTVALTTQDSLFAWFAVLDRHLARANLTLRDYAYFDNLLAESYGPFSRDERLKSSGLLRFKMLQLLDKAIAGTEGDGTLIDGDPGDPVKKAWFIAHEDLVEYFGPAGQWSVRGEAFWRLYEENVREPWADDLAWMASRHGPGTDACEAACVLKRIIAGPYQYWVRLPGGVHVAEALRAAGQEATYAETMGFCFIDPARPGEKRDVGVDPDDIKQIRSSLMAVSHPLREQILAALMNAERKCQ